jgi:hypothetical protein
MRLLLAGIFPLPTQYTNHIIGLSYRRRAGPSLAIRPTETGHHVGVQRSIACGLTDSFRTSRRLFKKARHLTRPAPARQEAPFRGQGRSKRRGERVRGAVREASEVHAALNKARQACEHRRDGEAAVSPRTPLADFVNSLLGKSPGRTTTTR